MSTEPDPSETLVRMEVRKVCERGHSPWGWRPWYRSSRRVLGTCACGAAYRLERREMPPLSKRGVALAADRLVESLGAPLSFDRGEAVAAEVVRAYLAAAQEGTYAA